MVSCSSIIVRCLCFIVFISFIHISRLPTVGTGERQVIDQWAKSLAITSMGKAAHWGGVSSPKGRPDALCRITRGTRALAVKRGLMCATDDDELRVSWLLVQCIPAIEVPVPVPYFYRLGRQCSSKCKWF